MGHKGPVFEAWMHLDRNGLNPNANKSINQPEERLQHLTP
jgi:hypothetical protein